MNEIPASCVVCHGLRQGSAGPLLDVS